VRLVVFDLDGTITRRDTLLPYVAGLLSARPWSLLRLLRVVPALAAHLLGLVDRGALKAVLLTHTLGGRTRAEIDSWNARYIPRLLARGVRPQALEAIEEHRRGGDLLVLMSAAPDLYAPALASRLGFAATICTGVRWTNDRLDGALTTANRRGPEKARCFLALKQQHPGLPTTAYGNSSADLPHLVLADEPRLVNASCAARWAGRRAGVAPYAHWR